MSQSPFDDLKNAAEHMRHAAETMAEKVLGEETQGHLREAARHVVQAARSALDQADECLKKHDTPRDGDTADKSTAAES